MKTLLYCIAAILFAPFANAQIQSASVQVSGLTCSMCNLSVKKSIEKVAFVEKVVPNVEDATYAITFKKGSDIQLPEIQKAVKKAGFSVAMFAFKVALDQVSGVNGNEFKVGNTQYHVVNKSQVAKSGITQFQITDKGFIADKDLKKYSSKNKSNVVNIVTI